MYGGLPSQSDDTPQSYLERMYVEAEDVDACLAAVSAINFDKWELDLRKADLSNPNTKQEVEAQLQMLPKARQAVANGTLLSWLKPYADAAKATIELRHTQWQAMYEQNCGGK